MKLEKEITKLQEEYQKIITEIENIKEQLKIKKQNYEEKEYEFDRENNKLYNINEDIDSNIENNRKNKQQYIRNSLEELELKLSTICSLILGLIGLILCLTSPKNIGILSTILFTGIFAYLGTGIGFAINALYQKKYKIKLETKYQESNENKEYQSQLIEFQKRKEIITKEHQIKYQIYKSAKDEYTNHLNLINIKKEELNQIKEQLISLVFPNNSLDEEQELTATNSFEEPIPYIDGVETQSKIKKKIPSKKNNLTNKIN